MKLYRRNFMIDKNRIYIIPTVIVQINDLVYVEKNYSLEFHWLMFHARLLWLDRKENE